MRYALISDIHANLPTLKSVYGHITERAGIDAIYHLGDLVGYAPWPNEVVDLITTHGVAGVAGNYDSTVGTDYRHCGCRYEDPRREELSHLSCAWTRQHVSPRSSPCWPACRSESICCPTAATELGHGLFSSTGRRR